MTPTGSIVSALKHDYANTMAMIFGRALASEENHLATDAGRTPTPIPDSTSQERPSHDNPCKCRAAPRDLLHFSASQVLALGESLPIIGKLLCHTPMQTAARYAHLARDTVKASAVRIGDSIENNLDTLQIASIS